MDEVVLAGEEVNYRVAFSRFSSLVNHAGHPALVMPLHEAGEPPPALQLVGPDWSEARLLEIGLAFEARDIVRFRAPG